jgi:arylsulfatase A-like enzyme
LRNVSLREGEDDYFVAQTMLAAVDWLRENHDRGPFFLHVDSFDPHEPWDPPQAYVERYDPGYRGDEIIYPAYAPADYLTAGELNHVRALYAAEVTLADRWLGELFAEIERLDLWDDTVVVLMSDHGIVLGEHGVVGKAWDQNDVYECYPLYEELVRIPLMMRVPGMGPRHVPDLVQPMDLMPTICEWAGAADPGTMHGVSLVETIEDTSGGLHAPPHELVVSSRALDIPQSRNPLSTITDGAWTLFFGGERTPGELYYLPDDPAQEKNLIDEARDVALEFHAWYVALLEELEVPENRLAPWRAAP